MRLLRALNLMAAKQTCTRRHLFAVRMQSTQLYSLFVVGFSPPLSLQTKIGCFSFKTSMFYCDRFFSFAIGIIIIGNPVPGQLYVLFFFAIFDLRLPFFVFVSHSWNRAPFDESRARHSEKFRANLTILGSTNVLL